MKAREIKRRTGFKITNPSTIVEYGDKLVHNDGGATYAYGFAESYYTLRATGYDYLIRRASLSKNDDSIVPADYVYPNKNTKPYDHPFVRNR